MQQRTAKILLAEDDPISRKTFLLILSKLGLKVDAVADGSEVTKAINKKNYDLILMDCQMPAMDGYALTQEIRKREKRDCGIKHIPIVAVTAHALQEDRGKCLDAGMDDYISKPIEIEKLVAVLEKFLQIERVEK